MENSLETKTKKYITSLLTSTPLAVTLYQLSKDYTNTIGEPIPYQRLGYNSLEHFLRSIPDTVNVRGSGSNAEVVPVVSEKSVHVYALVANQRVAKPRRKQYGSQRRRLPCYGPPRMCAKPIYENPKPPPLMRKIIYPPVNSTPTVSSATVSSTSSYPSPSHEYRNNNTKTEESHSNNTKVASPTYPPQTAKIEGAVVTRKQEEKKLDNRPIFETRQKAEDKTERGADVQSMKCTTNVKNLLKKITPDKNKFCVEQLESNIPRVIRNNLRTLIGQCPEGIWCAEVPDMYRKMFKQELNYQELGYRSLIDMCVCLSSIFHYVRPSTEDFKLYDRSRPLPDCAETIFTFASYNVNKSSDVETGALPNIDWADINMFLPKGIFKPGQEIPRTFIPTEMADYELDIDIVVGEIYDLSKFWIYMQDSLLDTLMDSIQEFYKDNALEYQIPEHLIKEGLYCVQVIFGEYHRALIVDVMPDLQDTIRVIFIDYGTMTKVPMKGACFLHEDFSHLPAQAIRCRLANVVPLEEGIPWSIEATKAFRKMVSNRDMSVKISHINWEDQFLEVYLADVTDEDNIFYINDRLVDEGYAQYPDKERKPAPVDPIYKPIVNYIHLFPTFLELEHGLAPSTAEMGIFYDCDVPINFCYPQYFFIDFTFEEEIIEEAQEFYERDCMRWRRRAPIRYFDLVQFKAPEPDMSIFGDLLDEINALMNMPAADQASTGSSDEDFVDADEEEFHARLDVMTEKFKYLTTKEEEAVNVLKEDLQMTEDIMNGIDFLCQGGEDRSVVESKESQYGNVESDYDAPEEDYFGLQEQAWELCTIKESRESGGSINSMEYCRESPGDSDYNHTLFSDHPLNKLTFKKTCSVGESSSSSSPQSEHNTTTKNAEFDLQQPDVWLRPINFSFLSSSNTSLTRILADKDTLAPQPGDRASSKKSGGDTQRKTCGNDFNSSVSSLGSSGKVETTAKANKCTSTNPFLQDEATTTESNNDLPLGLRLNPNNPFLTFLSKKNDEETSDSSQGSSTSTTYDSPIVQTKVTHSWLNFDDLSPETISLLGKTLSTNSSCDSRKTSGGATSCSIATQTIQERNNQNKVLPPLNNVLPPSNNVLPPSNNVHQPSNNVHQPLNNVLPPMNNVLPLSNNVFPPSQSAPPPYFGQQPPGSYNYPSWSTAFANPYYNVRFANHPSYPYHPTYGGMNPDRGPPGFPPPPGFAPLGSNAIMQSYPPRIQQGPTYYSRPLPYYGAGAPSQQSKPAIQLNGGVARASMSAVSVSVVSDNKDFYDVYNEHLRLQVASDDQ